MDYKKKYEKLVDAVKVLQDNNPSDEGIQNWVNDNVPELKESEDERIKKEIIDYIKTGIYHKKWIAWLEKQDNKPQGKSALEAIREEKVGNANKIEPKLKIEKDKWYVCIRDLDDNYGTKAFCKGSIYYSTKDETLLSDNSNIPFEIKYCVNDYFRPWTIQDAKDGDVLVTVDDENRPFIYKGCLDPNHPDSPVAYCGIDADGYFCSGGCKFNHWWTSDKVQPSTKEQRDTLMKAMTDAGYTFDFDKKELKFLISNGGDFESNNSKQKYVELSEEDEKMRKAILTGLIDCRDAPDLGWSNFGGIEIDDCIAWLEKQGEKDKLIRELGEYKVKYIQETLGKALTMNNKDDERVRKTTIAFLKDFADKGYENAVECIDWLEKQGEKEYAFKTFDDEDVRKFMQYIEKQAKAYELNLPNRSYDIYAFSKDLLSWIEKQGEQKHIDEDKPKFKVGDWILIDNPCRITSIDNNKNYHVQYCTMEVELLSPRKFCEKYFHLWTINDAKDGDVLAFDNDTIVIFKDLYNSTSFHSYCHIEDGIFDFNKDELPDWWNGEGFKPATKEQSDILFQKMKKAGYVWDAEKKELMKVEQNHNNWSDGL